MKIEYYETTMQDVLNYFIQGFKENGITINNFVPFVDSNTGKILLKLYIEKEEE